MPIVADVKKIIAKLSGFFFTAKRAKGGPEFKPWLKHYDAGVPNEIYIPEITLNDLFQRTVRLHRNQTAFCYFGRKFSYRQFDKAVERVAAVLQEFGLLKGDRVALILPNTPQFLISYWAALRIGAIVVPLNPLLSGPEIATSLNIAEPRLLILLDRIYNKIQHRLTECAIQYIVLTSIESFMSVQARVIYFMKSTFAARERRTKTRAIAFEKLAADTKVRSVKGVKPSDAAVLLFTGGVTGTSKAVALTHKNLLANVLQTRAWLGDLRDGTDVVIGVLPFFHSYGMTVCHHLAIQSGSMLIVEPRFNAQRVVRLIKKYKVTIFPGVPTMYRAIVDNVSAAKKRLEHVRVCVSGGAPLSPDLKRQFEAWTASTLVEGYGLTEASPLTHCNPLAGEQHVGSIGLPCPNTQARIVHLKSGRPLAPEALGELQVKGPQVMASYWRNDAETKYVLSADGWLSTGDIARMDKDGFFYIVDRKKDIILIGGFNVYPSEVEAVLHQHPCVKECAVTGVEDDYYGQVAKAFVVLYAGEQCDEEDLQLFCQEKLARYKIPRYVEFVDDLPRNFLGKVVRRKLKRAT
ncbi:long-chain fatty acid--CoA ligase [candidate division KSB1 bacterium]|nr:long-chain fatty acid--CoA ligase [candidate division KSB1 bacterium]